MHCFESYSETMVCGSEMHLLLITLKTAMSELIPGGKKITAEYQKSSSYKFN